MSNLQFYLFVWYAPFFKIGVTEIKKFDNEYQTDLPLEVAYLKECGIRYSFVKVVNNVTVWKYEKTEALGLALAQFWKRK